MNLQTLGEQIYFEGQPSDTWTISIIEEILIINFEEILITNIEEILKKKKEMKQMVRLTAVMVTVYDGQS